MLLKYIGLIAGLLIPVSAALAGVNFDFDKTADFSSFQTYSMGEMSKLSSQLQQQQLQQTLEDQLAAQGLTKIDSGGDLVRSDNN